MQGPSFSALESAFGDAHTPRRRGGGRAKVFNQDRAAGKPRQPAGSLVIGGGYGQYVFGARRGQIWASPCQSPILRHCKDIMAQAEKAVAACYCPIGWACRAWNSPPLPRIIPIDPWGRKLLLRPGPELVWMQPQDGRPDQRTPLAG